MARIYEIDTTLARALDLLGERWTLLIIQQLLEGDQRFRDLYGSLLGISSNLLTMRLRRLQKHGIIEQVHPEGQRRYYRLTERGRALAPVVWSLDAWAQSFLPKDAANRAASRTRAARWQ